MNEIEFIRHFIANAPQIMWFLGAGTSRTAGLPTATDIIWDLKIKYYCLKENQDIKQHDINNDAIKKKVQSYLDSQGFPKLWSNEEYSFYFNLTFGNDYSAQRKYLSEQLGTEKLSLNIGHKILAALIALQKTKLLFTTNFDEVIEQAYSKVSGKNLPTFNLEGSYAALDALNNESFPIYAKIHGDFKYQSIKNLSQDLLVNDEQIQNCLLAALGRYGLIVTGYSGRDQNVMSMFYKAIDLHNAFPSGLFWTTPNINDVTQPVKDFIQAAQAKGITAHIVEAGTFDTMLAKIWRQMPNVPDDLRSRTTTSNAIKTEIPLLPPGNQFPILRTNALPILELPNKCASITLKSNPTYGEVKDKLSQNRPNAIVTKTDLILGWGSEIEFKKGLGEDQITDIVEYNLDNPVQLISDFTFYKAFYERALVTALCNEKPLRLKNDKGFYITIAMNQDSNLIFQPLKDALKDYSGQPGIITGKISNNIYWSEALSVDLEQKNGNLWLIIQPTIWIEPRTERRNNIDFIKRRKLKRYNKVTSAILDAWIKILFAPKTKGELVEVSCFGDYNYPAKFKINTRTAYSKK